MRLLIPILLLTLHTQAFAAQAGYAFSSDNTSFVFAINFDTGYSNFQELNDGTSIVLSFDTSESLAFDQLDFFDSGLRSVRLETDGARKLFYFTFENALISPHVLADGRSIRAEFALPATAEAVSPTEVPSAIPATGAYVRMILGVGLILVIILVAYGVMKYLFKHSAISDIPGIGRMLGKVDIELKKSLVFYELGEVIYILGVTDGSISVVDKVTDSVDVNLLKAGFSRRKNFSSYMRFFRKNTDVTKDIEESNDALQERLSSLRKK
jgi:flagellar biogenesis protein FliO